MKTLIIQGGIVVNVGAGEPHAEAPEGFSYVVVEDDAYVGIGSIVGDDGIVGPPPQVEKVRIE